MGDCQSYATCFDLMRCNSRASALCIWRILGACAERPPNCGADTRQLARRWQPNLRTIDS